MAENAIIGDRDPKNPTHTATEEALEHAGASLGVPIAAGWSPTASLEGRAAGRLRGFDGVFCSPGGPYESMDGALEAIRFAREGGVPFIGTCGGFQHAVIEYARNVLGLEDAGHAEYDPDGEARIVELPGHDFCVATLFVPQMRSAPGRPHPLISAFVAAAADSFR